MLRHIIHIMRCFIVEARIARVECHNLGVYTMVEDNWKHEKVCKASEWIYYFFNVHVHENVVSLAVCNRLVHANCHENRSLWLFTLIILSWPRPILRSAGQKVSRSNTCWREIFRKFFWNFRIDKLRKLSTLLSDLLTQQQKKFPTLSCIQTSSKLRKFFATTIKSPFTTVVSSPSLAWQLLSIVLALKYLSFLAESSFPRVKL